MDSARYFFFIPVVLFLLLVIAFALRLYVARRRSLLFRADRRHPHRSRQHRTFSREPSPDPRSVERLIAEGDRAPASEGMGIARLYEWPTMGQSTIGLVESTSGTRRGARGTTLRATDEMEPNTAFVVVMGREESRAASSVLPIPSSHHPSHERSPRRSHHPSSRSHHRASHAVSALYVPEPHRHAIPGFVLTRTTDDQTEEDSERFPSAIPVFGTKEELEEYKRQYRHENAAERQERRALRKWHQRQIKALLQTNSLLGLMADGNSEGSVGGRRTDSRRSQYPTGAGSLRNSPGLRQGSTPAAFPSSRSVSHNRDPTVSSFHSSSSPCLPFPPPSGGRNVEHQGRRRRREPPLPSSATPYDAVGRRRGRRRGAEEEEGASPSEVRPSAVAAVHQGSDSFTFQTSAYQPRPPGMEGYYGSFLIALEPPASLGEGVEETTVHNGGPSRGGEADPVLRFPFSSPLIHPSPMPESDAPPPPPSMLHRLFPTTSVEEYTSPGVGGLLRTSEATPGLSPEPSHRLGEQSALGSVHAPVLLLSERRAVPQVDGVEGTRPPTRIQLTEPLHHSVGGIAVPRVAGEPQEAPIAASGDGLIVHDSFSSSPASSSVSSSSSSSLVISPLFLPEDNVAGVSVPSDGSTSHGVVSIAATHPGVDGVPSAKSWLHYLASTTFSMTSVSRQGGSPPPYLSSDRPPSRRSNSSGHGGGGSGLLLHREGGSPPLPVSASDVPPPTKKSGESLPYSHSMYLPHSSTEPHIPDPASSPPSLPQDTEGPTIPITATITTTTSTSTTLAPSGVIQVAPTTTVSAVEVGRSPSPDPSSPLSMAPLFTRVAGMRHTFKPWELVEEEMGTSSSTFPSSRSLKDTPLFLPLPQPPPHGSTKENLSPFSFHTLLREGSGEGDQRTSLSGGGLTDPLVHTTTSSSSAMGTPSFHRMHSVSLFPQSSGGSGEGIGKGGLPVSSFHRFSASPTIGTGISPLLLLDREVSRARPSSSVKYLQSEGEALEEETAPPPPLREGDEASARGNASGYRPSSPLPPPGELQQEPPAGSASPRTHSPLSIRRVSRSTSRRPSVLPSPTAFGDRRIAYSARHGSPAPPAAGGVDPEVEEAEEAPSVGRPTGEMEKEGTRVPSTTKGNAQRHPEAEAEAEAEKGAGKRREEKGRPPLSRRPISSPVTEERKFPSTTTTTDARTQPFSTDRTSAFSPLLFPPSLVRGLDVVAEEADAEKVASPASLRPGKEGEVVVENGYGSEKAAWETTKVGKPLRWHSRHTVIPVLSSMPRRSTPSTANTSTSSSLPPPPPPLLPSSSSSSSSSFSLREMPEVKRHPSRLESEEAEAVQGEKTATLEPQTRSTPSRPPSVGRAHHLAANPFHLPAES